MLCRINLETDPISLTIIAADGLEHTVLDKEGHDALVNATVIPLASVDADVS